jgi:hypothetical protein
VPVYFEDHLAAFVHSDVRCQLRGRNAQALNVFDTVIQRISLSDDGTILVSYDGGALALPNAEIVEHTKALIIRSDDWSLVVIRWADMPNDVERLPRASLQ